MPRCLLIPLFEKKHLFNSILLKAEEEHGDDCDGASDDNVYDDYDDYDQQLNSKYKLHGICS